MDMSMDLDIDPSIEDDNPVVDIILPPISDDPTDSILPPIFENPTMSALPSIPEEPTSPVLPSIEDQPQQSASTATLSTPPSNTPMKPAFFYHITDSTSMVPYSRTDGFRTPLAHEHQLHLSRRFARYPLLQHLAHNLESEYRPYISVFTTGEAMTREVNERRRDGKIDVVRYLIGTEQLVWRQFRTDEGVTFNVLVKEGQEGLREPKEGRVIFVSVRTVIREFGMVEELGRERLDRARDEWLALESIPGDMIRGMRDFPPLLDVEGRGG